MTQIITNNSGWWGWWGWSKVIVVDDLNTQSSTSALSANQWYVLKWMIDDLMAQGRFLSLWNCATWQPVSFPLDIPYTYSTWDYFMVEVIDEPVDDEDTATNYRPNGSSYTGTASSTVETWEVAIWDYYVYDWAVWLLASNHWKTVSFANLAWQPTDNVPLWTALAWKQDNWIEVNVATAYGTAAKVWTTTAGDYTPTKWDFLLVNFVNGCSVDNPTLNIDWSGAKNIRTGSANANKSTFALWTTANSNIKALLYYDWTYYRCWSTTNTNTTYSSMSVSEWQTGTATSQRSMTAANLKSIIKYHAVDNSRLSDDRYSKINIAPSLSSIYYEFDKRDIQAWTDLEIVWISSHNLPDWYTELAYLWGSGSWYIDTWKILNCRDSIRIKFKRTANTYSSVMAWFGSTQGSSSIPRYWIWVRTSWDFFTWANSTIDIAQTDMNAHTLEMWYDNGYFYKWDWWAKTTYTPDSETNPTMNAYLFARNGSSVTYSWWVRIYYVEWAREDWTDVAHLIPAQRDSDGVLGMYDLVSDTFLAPSWSGAWFWSPLGNVINFTNDSGFLTSSTWVTSVNGNHWAVTVNEPIVSATAPSSPTEWMIWYDTTNDVLKTYDGSQWNEAWWWGGGGDSTIKAFYLSSTSDLVTAQAIYDWFNAGKTPLVVIDDGSVLTVYNSSSSSLCFTYPASYLSSENDTNWDTIVNIEVLYINLSNWAVTDLEWVGEDKWWGHYLETWYDYPTPYTPEYDWSPATKKYVDDSASVVSGNIGTKYTIKVSNSAPASWTPNTTITFRTN